MKPFSISLLVALLAGCAGATSPLAATHALSAETAASSACTVINGPNGPALTLSSINDENELTGYTGTPPNVHSYVLEARYRHARWHGSSYPASGWTLITSINDHHTIAGYYSDFHDAIFGFARNRGVWNSYKYPHVRGNGSITQLFGLNDAGIAVGAYADASKIEHAFLLDANRGRFRNIHPPGVSRSSIAAGINRRGDVTGFFTNESGNMVSFLLRNGRYTVLAEPSGIATRAAGLNASGRIVGSYDDASGNTHGFLLSDPLTSHVWTNFDWRNATATSLAGINDRGNFIGNYTDGSGSHGFLCKN